MTNHFKKVAVILPVHNEEDFIGTAIKSLQNQTYPSSLIEIIVVNNNSTDKSVQIAELLGVRVIHQNEGPVGRVRNTGAWSTDATILFFMDSDCVAPREWIEVGVNFTSENFREVGAGGLRLPEKPRFLEKYWLLTSKKGEMLPSELLGSCLILPKSLFVEMGGFDETITAGEDSALHRTFVSANIPIRIRREFSVVHLGNAVTMKSFLKRQIWHSENYFKNLTRSLTDLVFLIVVVFLLSTLGFLFTIREPQSYIFLTAICLCVALRSVKRIHSSGNYIHIKSLPQILMLDLLYLSGRSMGLIKGMIQRFLSF